VDARSDAYVGGLPERIVRRLKAIGITVGIGQREVDQRLLRSDRYLEVDIERRVADLAIQEQLGRDLADNVKRTLEAVLRILFEFAGVDLAVVIWIGKTAPTEASMPPAMPTCTAGTPTETPTTRLPCRLSCAGPRCHVD